MNHKRNNKAANYLDKVPAHSIEYWCGTDEPGRVVILRNNEGLFNRIVQRFFHKPAVSYIHLDEMGSFIWMNINGRRSVYDIAGLVEEHFGEAAEPLYNRLVRYMGTLSKCGFIVFY